MTWAYIMSKTLLGRWTSLGSLHRSPVPLAGTGAHFAVKREGKGRGGKGKEEEEREDKTCGDPLHSSIPPNL